MVRSKRLLSLIDILSKPEKFNARELAVKLGVSERTIFRDINTLREEGAQIEYSEDTGFILSSGWRLPPVMFTQGELEVISLGLQWVSIHTDNSLKKKAQHAMAKINAALSPDQKKNIKNSCLIIAPKDKAKVPIELDSLRSAIDQEIKVFLTYVDLNGNVTNRIIWPFAIAYYENVSLLIAWCEKRQDFRNFRTDRFLKIEYCKQKYPNSKLGLHQLWLQKIIQLESSDKN
ncbi:YafY family protein [uncultured Acinetobacter sp.]|uniref:helix-turn-helix transcriptional regulator n=1 Tax=uncultured Acinetobacter sp. TaxID=165433 RepID=UPI00258593F4|nr:YafY family protein [uncultured Acinetobacter sp.]